MKSVLKSIPPGTINARGESWVFFSQVINIEFNLPFAVMRGVPAGRRGLHGCGFLFKRYREIRLRPPPAAARTGPIPHCISHRIASHRSDLVKDFSRRGSRACFLWEKVHTVCTQRIRTQALDVELHYCIQSTSSVSQRHLGSLWGSTCFQCLSNSGVGYCILE